VFSDDIGGYDEASELRDAVGLEPPPPEPTSESRKHTRKRKKGRALEADADRDGAGDYERGRNRDNNNDSDDLDDDDKPRPRRRRRTALVVGLTTFIGLAVGTLVLLGYINGGRYAIACESEQILAERGRTFPPWGMRTLGGDLWKPIKIPANAECRERESEDEYELGGWYLGLLVDRASTLLTAREVTKADEAAGMLEQALLHARAPERRDQRKEIERLLGDVGYWRASAKLRDAANALTDAAKQFDSAAAQRPRHVSDASSWAAYARKVAEELRTGPADAKSPQAAQPTPTAPSGPERPAAPTGVALPIEPDRAGSGSSGGSGSAAAPAPSATPDAGVPTGGVLL